MPSRTRKAWITLWDKTLSFCLNHDWVPHAVDEWVSDRFWKATRNVTLTAVGDIQKELGIEVPCEWDSDGKPVDFMYFRRTHVETDTCRDGCVIHRRTGHHMCFWPLHWRGDRGIFERLCPLHGIGHPDPDQGPYWKASGQDWQWVHGCCGCCNDNYDRYRENDNE